jgi:hypothetical protein
MNRRIIGYIFFGLSFIMWLVPICVGFFGLSAKNTAIAVTAAIVAGEVCFVVSLLILGKAFWTKIKRFGKVYWWKVGRFFRGG